MWRLGLRFGILVLFVWLVFRCLGWTVPRCRRCWRQLANFRINEETQHITCLRCQWTAAVGSSFSARQRQWLLATAQARGELSAVELKRLAHALGLDSGKEASHNSQQEHSA